MTRGLAGKFRAAWNRPSRRAAAAALAVAAVCISAAAWSQDKPAEAKTDRVAALAWMTGDWRDAAGSTHETWLAPSGGAMVGVCRMGQSAEKAIYEMMLIEQQGDEVFLLLKHYGPGLKDWHAEPYKYRLARGGEGGGADGKGAGTPRELLFENPRTDRHARIIYSQPTPDELHCRLEDKAGGKRKPQEFRFQREKSKS